MIPLAMPASIRECMSQSMWSVSRVSPGSSSSKRCVCTKRENISLSMTSSRTRVGGSIAVTRIRHGWAVGIGAWRIFMSTTAPTTSGNSPTISSTSCWGGVIRGTLRVSRWNAKTSAIGAAISTERSKTGMRQAWQRRVGEAGRLW